MDSRGMHYLRGEQSTNKKGFVKFKTIFPGWYVGRPVHIHVKVVYEGGEMTTQIYFPTKTTAEAMQSGAYKLRGMPRKYNDNEEIPNQLIQKARNNGDGSFSSFISLGIDVDVEKFDCNRTIAKLARLPN